MMKIKKKTTRLMVWSLTGSVLASSCTCNDINIIDEIQEFENHPSCAIHISMSNRHINRINELASLADKIVNDRSFAKQIVGKTRGLAQNSTLMFGDDDVIDDALKNVIRALADDDIAEAVKNNDVKQYLLLMNKKGYIDDIAKYNDYQNLMSVEDKKRLLESVGYSKIIDKDLELAAVAAVVIVFYAAVVAVSWVSVGYTIAAALNMALSVTVVAYSAAAVNTSVVGEAREKIGLSSNFDVYLLSASSENLNITFSDENINNIIKDAADAYSEIFIKDVERLDVEKFKQTINLNVSKQPEIAKSTIILMNNKK